MVASRRAAPRLVEAADDLLIAAASATPIVHDSRLKTRYSLQFVNLGHPVYTAGCPEVYRW